MLKFYPTILGPFSLSYLPLLNWSVFKSTQSMSPNHLNVIDCQLIIFLLNIFIYSSVAQNKLSLNVRYLNSLMFYSWSWKPENTGLDLNFSKTELLSWRQDYSQMMQTKWKELRVIFLLWRFIIKCIHKNPRGIIKDTAKMSDLEDLNFVIKWRKFAISDALDYLLLSNSLFFTFCRMLH